MAEYFSRIDIKRKIDLTIKDIFERSKPECISFIESTPDFRKRLNQVPGYVLIGPQDAQDPKQTLIMLKDTLPFIPSNYSNENAMKEPIKANFQ
jgi:hypothetical protein